MSSAAQPSTPPRSTGLRVFAALTLLFFAFTAIYTPIHLILENHTGDSFSLTPLVKVARDDAPPTHTPHPASDHVREILPAKDSVSVAALLAVLPALAMSGTPTLPEHVQPLHFPELVNPPAIALVSLPPAHAPPFAV